MRYMLPLLAVLALGCSQNEFNITPIAQQPPGEQSLSGRSCDVDRQMWISGAQVYTHLYDEHGVIHTTLSTHTDEGGHWTLSGLAGGYDYEIYVQKGHEVVQKFIVTMPDGEGDHALPSPTECLGDVDLYVAVVTGAYDDLASVFQAIGLQGYHVVDGQRDNEIVHFLSNPENLTDYDVIFFDGGHNEEGVFYGDSPHVETVQQTLRDYVEGGGVVYATDWAYDVVEQTWPDAIDWVGDDWVPNAAQLGEPGTITAQVTEPGLQGAVGQSTLNITYDLPVWPVISAVAADVTVYLRGDARYRQAFEVHTLPDAPLMVEFQRGEGRVVFSTFRNHVNTEGDALSVLNAIISTL